MGNQWKCVAVLVLRKDHPDHYTLAGQLVEGGRTIDVLRLFKYPEGEVSSGSMADVGRWPSLNEAIAAFPGAHVVRDRDFLQMIDESLYGFLHTEELNNPILGIEPGEAVIVGWINGGRPILTPSQRPRFAAELIDITIRNAIRESMGS